MEPTDSITISCKVSSRIEACNDYIEEGDQKLARSGFGQLLRQKVQITISYDAGQNPVSRNFSNLTLSMDHCKHSVYSE